MNRRFALKSAAAAGLLALVAGCADTGGNIVEIASSNDDFSTLVAAVSAAGLADTLATGGPFTVFAPTNEAFAALPAGTVENLLKPENVEQLQKILTYHVIPGTFTSSSLLGQRGALVTVEGSPVIMDATKNTVTVNDATVIAADVAASNGVIHAIDTVLLPK